MGVVGKGKERLPHNVDDEKYIVGEDPPVRARTGMMRRSE
jgi:hypothetical protein